MEPQGVRLPWSQVPERVRTAVGDRLGSPVIEAVNEPGGFSPGVAARCGLADGRRAFVKAVSPAQNPESPSLHRREAEVVAALPPEVPTPGLIDVHDDGEWVVLVFEEIEGANPSLPWTLADLAATFEAIDEIIACTDPCPARDLERYVDVRTQRRSFGHWRRLHGGDAAEVANEVPTVLLDHLDELAALESGWSEAADGAALVHADLRADNLLLRPDGTIVVVDWPWAAVGARWIDKLLMLPSVGLDGGPSPCEVTETLDPFAGVEDDALDAVLAALTGFFVIGGLQPDPPGLPTVRAFQRAQGEVATGWLAHRRGWW